MDHLALTYQHIADILSFETTNSELEQRLSDPNFNWDAIVIEGSKHLVLPALYCRLKSKSLLHVLPEELHTYLEELTAINRNRNASIIEQAHSLSALLHQNTIEHVFLKGTALLLSGTFEDIAERMIGDIDILINTNQTELAFDLLKNNGYYPISQTLGYSFFGHKHLPRLKTKQHISAVELHEKLFVSYKDKALINANVLLEKQTQHKVPIPSMDHLLRHNILNYQINDNGKLHNSISFRSAYDTVVLLRQQDFKKGKYRDSVFKSYFNITGLFFEDIGKTFDVRTNFSTAFYRFKLKHLKFYKFWNKALNLFNFLGLLLRRVPFFVSNQAYRKAVFNDRKRVYKYFKSVLNNI